MRSVCIMYMLCLHFLSRSAPLHAIFWPISTSIRLPGATLCHMTRAVMSMSGLMTRVMVAMLDHMTRVPLYTQGHVTGSLLVREAVRKAKPPVQVCPPWTQRYTISHSDFMQTYFDYYSPPSSSPSLPPSSLQFLSVSALRQGPQTFPDDPAHPLPPLVLGGSQDRARLALESIAKVSS